MLELYQAMTATAALLLALGAFVAVLQKHSSAGMLMFLTGIFATAYFTTVSSIPVLYPVLSIALSVTGVLWRTDPPPADGPVSFDDSTLRRRYR